MGIAHSSQKKTSHLENEGLCEVLQEHIQSFAKVQPSVVRARVVRCQ